VGKSAADFAINQGRVARMRQNQAAPSHNLTSNAEANLDAVGTMNRICSTTDHSQQSRCCLP